MTVEQSTPTTLVQEGCTLKVVVQMAFINETALHRDEDGAPIADTCGNIEKIDDRIVQHITTCWLESARQIWHNLWLDPLPPHKWFCYDVEFVFLPRVGWPSITQERLHFHKIVVKYDLPAGSWVTNPMDASFWVEDDPVVLPEDELRAYGEWDINDRPEPIAHEIGHILKLKDEYGVHGAQSSEATYDPPDSEYHDNSQDPRCLMMSTSANVVMPTVHVHSILKDLGAPADLGCCHPVRLIELIGAIAQWFRGRVLVADAPFGDPPLGDPPFPGPGPEPDPGPGPPWGLFDSIDSVHGPALARVGNWVGSHSVFGVTALRERVLDQKGNTSRQRWLASIALGQARKADHAEARDALLQALVDPDISVRMLTARSLNRLGSRKGVPVLIGALSSDALMIREPVILARIYADRLLELISGTTVGFLPYASEGIRAQGVGHWKEWWTSQPESND